jgi:hypothetical protein
MSIPISWYNINSTNNTLIVVINSVPITFTIPVGNYDATSLADTMSFSYQDKHICGDYNPITLKMTLIGTVPFSVSPLGTVNSILGFSSAVSSPSQRYGGTCPSNASYVTGAVIDLGGTRSLIIKSNFRTGNMIPTQPTSTTILACIPIENSPGTVQVYKNNSGFRSKTPDQDNMNAIDIEIFDDAGNRMDFNNINWSLTLQFDFVYSLNEPLYTPSTITDVVSSLDTALDAQGDIMPVDMLPTSDGFENNINTIIGNDEANQRNV